MFFRVRFCEGLKASGGLMTLGLLILALQFGVATSANAQKKGPAKQSPKSALKAPTELEKLRTEYINATKDYKASLEKLLPLYDRGLQQAEERLAKDQELFKQGLIAKKDLGGSEKAVADAKAKIDEVHKQMGAAETQMAQVLVEVETEKQIRRLPKGGMIQTTSFIRFNGIGPWAISQAGSVDAFFRQKFGHALPIAVLGQGAIHNRWRLDHHNAMDLSLNPDGVEGKAVMDYLRGRGIPFSAFRQAIPGTATGPHIHVGLPSHRY
ncbi:MAG: TolC family protein [Acidobacteriota bacterium]|nr:TolC family protein [Acidobacteriota bacterium]